MPQPIEPMAQPRTGLAGVAANHPKKTLAGLGLTATAIAGLFTMIPHEESGRTTKATIDASGNVQVTNVRGNLHQHEYLDSVGVRTICDGDTHNVVPGETDTPEQCRQRLETQLVNHAAPVLQCVPVLARFDFANQLVASVDLAYNIGPAGFCGSTVAREFNARHYIAACNAFLRFNRAGGRVLAGLDARRHREQALCMIGFGPKR